MNGSIGRRAVVAGGLACWAMPSIGRGRGVPGAPAGYSGIALVARKGRVERIEAFGLADIERRVPMTVDTRFAFGSATKWLTSVAVLRLAERGRLALDAPIGRYLPELLRDAGEQVRLEHLLSNTSGLVDQLTPALRADEGLRASEEPATAMVARYATGGLRVPPGTDFDYTPLNWVLVNAIVTRAADRPFAEALRELVCAPLGLGSVALASEGWDRVPGMAAAYRAGEPPVRRMDRVPAFLAASGNAVGTAVDAMRAAHGIFATRFLTPASRAQLVRVRWPAEDYALGGRVRAIGGERWAWETGKVAGYRALIAQNLARDETIVLLNNRDAEQSALAGWAEAIVRG